MLTDRNLSALLDEYHGRKLSLEQLRERILLLANGVPEEKIEDTGTRVGNALDMLSRGEWPGWEAMALLEEETQKGNLVIKPVKDGT